MWLKSVFSNSMGAMILSSPVSFRSFCARCFSMTGPYVSGKKINSGQVTPASIAPTQKPQAQLTTDMYPEIGGPRIGPKVVAAMKPAMLRPRLLGSWYMSAHMPPTTLIAQLPPMPTRRRKITSAAKFGETAEVIEKIVKMAKDIIITSLRP